jgi:predicted transcriptional regulator
MEKKDIRDDIMNHLKSIERPMSWLSNKAEIPYATLYSVFKQKNFKISDKNLDKINKVLGTDFINY